jgi:hypothetical protein
VLERCDKFLAVASVGVVADVSPETARAERQASIAHAGESP